MPDFRNAITQNGVAVSLNGHTHTGIARGTAFPTSPAPVLGDEFTRTDFGFSCYYDGTRWLGPVSPIPFQLWAGAPPPYTAANAILFYPAPQSLSFVVNSLTYGVFIATTNNASNYWTIVLETDTGAIDTRTTASLAANTITTIPVTTISGVKTANTYMRITISKTGSPGGLTITANLNHRRVYT